MRECVVPGLGRGAVRAAVKLELQAQLGAVGIHDEPAPHVLPAELEAQQTPIAEQSPREVYLVALGPTYCFLRMEWFPASSLRSSVTGPVSPLARRKVSVTFSCA